MTPPGAAVRRPRLERVLALTTAGLLSVQVLVVAERRARVEGTAASASAAPTEVAGGAVGSPASAGDVAGDTGVAAVGDPGSEPAGEPRAMETASSAIVVPGGAATGTRAADPSRPGVTSTGATTTSIAASAEARHDPARQRFERAYPSHAAASQDPSDAASTRWAVIIGINDHQGRTRDNIGSRQDAEDLARHLLELGWRRDHVLVLTDGAATREGIEQGLAWLSRKTDRRSVSVVHYSGHTKQWHHDIDGDGEVVDEGLWPSDNRFITDRRFAQLVDGVAGRSWVNIAACEAAGLADRGLARNGRVLTLSSREDEKSYEDPSVGNSVWGYFLIDEALAAGWADQDDDGDVTVQEAFSFAAPRATKRTSKQARGPQRPVLVDHTGGSFSLALPQPPPERSEDDATCDLPLCFGDDRRHR